MTSRLGSGKSITFFYSAHATIYKMMKWNRQNLHISLTFLCEFGQDMVTQAFFKDKLGIVKFTIVKTKNNGWFLKTVACPLLKTSYSHGSITIQESPRPSLLFHVYGSILVYFPTVYAANFF